MTTNTLFKRALKPVFFLLLFTTAFTKTAHAGHSDTVTLKVMTFNVLGAGAWDDKPVDETVAAIRAANADIIGIQETRVYDDNNCEYSSLPYDTCPPIGQSRAKAIADELGYYYYNQKKGNAAIWSNAVISRYPINDATKNEIGVSINVDGTEVYIFNMHLSDYPYQPYQLLDIEYGDAPFLDTAAQAIDAAKEARGKAIDLFFKDLKEASDAKAIFVTGDFNEPSWHDWTKEAVAAGNQPLRVKWPTAKRIEDAGFVDALRDVYPNEVQKKAFTWTPTTEPTDPADHHDRIDYIFVKARGVDVKNAAIVGENALEADIVVTPWPSDHRAVVATIKFKI
jgi:exonuclease III